MGFVRVFVRLALSWLDFLKFEQLRRRKKSRKQETKHLSTDADSSTDTTVGWTKNTQNPIFFEKPKKSSKTQKRKNV